MNMKIIQTILQNIYGNWCLPTKTNTSDINLSDEKWTPMNATEHKDKINEIIKQYDLKCEKTEMDIEGEKFILENWKTADGQMIIQRAYPASDSNLITPTYEPEKDLDGLNMLLTQSLLEERYEDAARYRDLIANFK